MLNILKRKYAAQIEIFKNSMLLPKTAKYVFICSIKPCLVFNPSEWQFKFRCRVSPAVLFSARHLNSDRELLYSS
jgi:hypothetical protein